MAIPKSSAGVSLSGRGMSVPVAADCFSVVEQAEAGLNVGDAVRGRTVGDFARAG
jgi:hypothetical protein